MIETQPLPLTDAAQLPAGAAAVLSFWLGEVPLCNAAALEKRGFSKSEALDAEIAHRFGDDVLDAQAGEYDH